MDENGESSFEERWSQNSRLQKYIRPHSARQKSSNNEPRVASPRSRRPVTAHPKIRSDLQHSKRVTRQNVKRSHLRSSARSSNSSPRSPENAIITAVSLDNEADETTSNEKFPSGTNFLVTNVFVSSFKQYSTFQLIEIFVSENMTLHRSS